MKLALAAIALCASMSSISAFAALDGTGAVSPNFSTNDFCSHPYEAVCSGYDETMADQVGRVRGATVAIHAQGLVAAGRAALAAGFWSGDPARFSQADLDRITADESLSLMLRLAVKGAYMAGMRQELRSRSEILRPAAAMLREELENAVARAAPTHLIGKMTDIIDDIHVVGADEALADGQDESVREKFFKFCGEDGMVNNSEALWVNSERYVFICTGSLSGAEIDPSSFFANAENAANNILWALGHEMGHHLGWPSTDDAELAALNAPYLSCLKNGFPRSYNEAMRGEALADYWAAETTYQHLLSMQQAGADRAKMLRILRQSWGRICETGSDGVHPTGRMRIEVILGLNPEISRIMGCGQPQQPDPSGCGL